MSSTSTLLWSITLQQAYYVVLYSYGPPKPFFWGRSFFFSGLMARPTYQPSVPNTPLLTWGSRHGHILSPPVCPSTPAFVIPGIGVRKSAGGHSLLVLVVAWVEIVEMQCVRKCWFEPRSCDVLRAGWNNFSKKIYISSDLCVHHHITQHHITLAQQSPPHQQWWQCQTMAGTGGKKGWRQQQQGCSQPHQTQVAIARSFFISISFILSF